MGGSLAGQLEGEAQRVWRGKGDSSKKQYLLFSLRPEFQNGRLGPWALQSDLPSRYSPADVYLSSASSSLTKVRPVVSSTHFFLSALAAGMLVQTPHLPQVTVIGLLRS